MQRYYLQVFGCQMNQNESGLVRSLLDEAGYEETPDEAEADIYLMLTCAVRSHAEARALGRLGSFRSRRRERVGRVIAVLGCMAETNRELLIEEHGADIVLGPDRYRLLPEAIAEATTAGRATAAFGTDGECYEGIRPRFPGAKRLGTRFSANGDRGSGSVRGSVVVMRGCDNWCSYCIVPLARGRERSRPLGQVLDECRLLLDRGCKDITLLGQNVLAWQDGSRDFVGLLEAVARLLGPDAGTRTPGFRLRFLTSHPRDFDERVARALASIPGVCPDLHLPVQSGSDRILELMNRGYTRAGYLERVSLARELLPGLGLSTDFLVGFPGESEDDFADTLELARGVRFDAGYMFRYSVRAGTAAETMGPKVSEAEAGTRLARLIRLQNRITSEKSRELVGREFELLIEARARRGHGMLGRTASNRTVIVEGQAGPGDFVTARVTGIRGWTPVAEPGSRERK